MCVAGYMEVDLIQNIFKCDHWLIKDSIPSH